MTMIAFIALGAAIIAVSAYAAARVRQRRAARLSGYRQPRIDIAEDGRVHLDFGKCRVSEPVRHFDREDEL